MYRVNPLTGEVDDVTLANLDEVFAAGNRKQWGRSLGFRAKVANCTDAIWVQYIGIEYRFYDAAGAQVGAPVTKSPAIDGQTPYQFQEGANGDAFMNDDAGANAVGMTAFQAAGGVLNAYKTEAAVTAGNITKVAKKMDFWTYLICLAPAYRVVGHAEWSFTQVVDIKTSPYISKTNETGPVWTAGR